MPRFWNWAKRHWFGFAGAVALLLSFVRFAHWLVMLGGDVDFIVARSQDPGWVGTALRLLAEPPPWSIPVVIFLGLASIYWDMRRNRKQEAHLNSQPSPPKLPITVTLFEGLEFHPKSGLGTTIDVVKDGVRTPIFAEPAFMCVSLISIGNHSTDRNLDLEIKLLTVDESDRRNRWACTDSTIWGKKLGRDDYASISAKQMGMEHPQYIVCPLKLSPQTAVKGRLPFVLRSDTGDESDEFSEMRYVRNLVWGLGGRHLKMAALEITDLISGGTVTLPLGEPGFRGLLEQT